MASIKDLRKRIGTVKNTQQTTKAMKMVSAAKLRRAQDAILSQRPYAKRLGAMIQHLAADSELQKLSPYFRMNEDATKPKKVLLLLVSSDRGLCGSFNANIIKGAARWVKQNGKDYSEVEFCFVGKRGFDFYKTKTLAKVGTYFAEQGGKVSFVKAKVVADHLTKAFLNEEYDEIKLVYNEFKNAISQDLRVEEFLPLRPEAPAADSKEKHEDTSFLIKPSPAALLQELLGKNFAIQIFRVMLESQAGEHGARMSAMENATKNAGEMIRDLTLQYNKQRQAGITKELLEIISGTESQKAS
jgi:F-type H+-transporting ATPase subunit gamma